MTTLQPFKANDILEPRVRDCALNVLDTLGAERDSFYAGAYQAAPLGDVLYNLARDPMTGVVTQEIFRDSFYAIHNLFTRPATFEYYLDVFRTIFGAGVNIEFDVPAPGKLLINVQALDAETFYLMARRITSNVYYYDQLVTTLEEDKILAVGSQGIKTQPEMDALIFELSVAGVWTVCTLTL